ncbi:MULTISPECIES: alpha-amylase family protein [unclassified Oceanispirochaeta]|uniref:alpha-amylase family protein n=1 Tax=unclassified Oceanispirochaeta TaxID=2635722 RepID=UPI000E0975FD|nr:MULTISPECIES: alpha-amylase family protein [unclassified Oceanispirochaeta]MBF9017435.1 beta-galactosidase trimerization domain-containing protein [Oceanispirochaeta sp. M2]NPD74007.1 beta-galactosidase [Oceanispirochaeta sp. M1]RDG30179.1 beta-galactosidase [Oceanispirochaeta sp. M1]
MKELSYRQIHMDFHTGDQIPRVGNEFKGDEFASILKSADVDSITCFARCHHGWLYYDSKKFPELVHPSLEQRDLLREQIEACHKEGIRVPIYTTIQWDGKMSYEHPEYCVVTPDGAIDGYKPHEPGFYSFLCVNTAYRDFLKEHLKEILTTLPVDGIFMDIVQERDCSCKSCMDGMKERGFDVLKKEQRMKYAHIMLREFKKEISSFIREYNDDCSIFFNGSHVGPGIRDSLGSYTHLEVESLPSGGWGYTHFPLVSRFTRGLGKEFVGMTGKFHTNWGDFHSYKNKASLEYECFNMLAQGGGCSIGDQLIPSGKIDRVAYDLIGSVYKSVKDKEPWCRNAESLADIGVFNLEEWSVGENPAAMIGALRLLEEPGLQFDLIDSLSDFKKYKLIIMADLVPVDVTLKTKLQAYLDNGGKILASFESGLVASGKKFAMESFGIEKIEVDDRDWKGDKSSGKDYHTNDYCDFIIPEGEFFRGLPKVEHSMYIRGLSVKAGKNTEVLSNTVKPWFYRDPDHFCGHQQTSSSGEIGTPAVTYGNDILYFSHPVFTIYRKKGPLWIKKMVSNGIEKLIKPRISHDGPSTLKVMVNRQTQERRWIIHLLHYIPEKRCEQIEIIEDIIPLYNISLSLLSEHRPLDITVVPEMKKVEFTYDSHKADFSISKIEGHCMVEVKYGD